MSQLIVDNIVGYGSTAPTYMPDGFSVPAGGTILIEGDVYNDPTGIATVGILTVSNATVGVITATDYYGDGTNLVTQIVPESRAIALVYIRA